MRTVKNFNAVKRHFMEFYGKTHREAVIYALSIHSLWISKEPFFYSSTTGREEDEEEEFYEIELFFSKKHQIWIGHGVNDGGSMEYDTFIEAEEHLLLFGMYRVG